MMITIQGLAPTTKYADVKKLIKQQCNIEDFILDNLLSDNDGTKKVRVGLADDSEGLKLMKYLDGYLMAGNYTVKVSPVGSKSAPSGPQGGYSGPSVYPNQSRNDYPNQMNTNDYNRPSHGPNTMRGPGGPQVPAGPHGYGGPQGSGGPAVWASNNNPNQWGPTSSMSEQVPQSTFNYRAGANPQGAQPGYMPQHGGPRSEGRPFEQGRQGPPVEPNYGSYQPKNGPRQNLRSIDTVETTTTPVGRYPANQYQQEKSGPTPFNITHPAGNQPSQFPQRGPNPSWEPPHQQSTENPFIKAIEDRKYPQGDQPRASKGFQPKPDTYKEYEKRRGFSPPRNPMARGMSPGRRDERDSAGKRDELRRDPPVRREEIQRDAGRMGDIGPRRPSPNRIDAGQRRVSPPGNRDEPRGRRFSPERRMSPGDRRNIPGGAGPEQQFPPRRVSPSRRLVSPGRRGDRDVHRYSPDRRPSDKMGDKFRPDNKDLKKVRPAYEPPSHAPNQPMFSSSFRPIAQEKPQYSGMRGEQPGAWNRHGDDSIKKHEDERRIQMGRERGPDKVDKRYSPGRKSRSPPRRDRSPIRDRIRRNSLSPRSSYSPRRSWALEKRRSPDAPPPPLWPGQDSDIDHGRPSRQKFPPEEKPKHQPVWEGRSFKEDEHRSRRPEERNPYDAAKLRVAKELMERESAHAGPSDRYQPKFSPRRDEYAERRDNYHRELPDRKVQADDFDLPRKPRDEGRRDDYNRREWGGGDSPGRASQIVSPEDFDKDFEDIYKRAVQFKKKTEELRKSGSRKRDDFDENSQRREDRGRHREEEPIRQQDVRRFDGGHREDQYPRDMQTTGREERVNDAAHYAASRNVREKREKAVDEIAHKILDRNEQYKHVEDDQKRYIIQELKTVVGNIIFDMFRDSDVSFIEIIIKFQAKYNLKDEAKILQDVMRSLPKHLRTMKRQAPDSMDVPTKTSRISPGPDLNQGRRSPAQHMRRNQPTLVVKKKLLARPGQRAIGPEHGSKPVHRAIRPEPISRPVQRPFRPEPGARPVQRAVGPESSSRPVQRTFRPEPGSRPVQRAVESRPGARPIQRADRPGPVARPIQRADRPGLGTRPVQRANRPEPGARPVQKAVGPKSGARPMQRDLRPQPRPVQRTVLPEDEARAIQRDVKNESGAETTRRSKPDPVGKPVQRVVKDNLVKTPGNQPAKTAVKRAASAVQAKEIQESAKRKKEAPKSPAATRERGSGDYQLNYVLTKSLEIELTNVMDKVSQGLVDLPDEEIENGTAGKVRNEAIPALKNVLGLNVTKRLLNVYNPLNVKVKFNGKPEKEELREFLKKYNFIGFVREAVNVFAAQVKGIDDFDRLCKDKEVKCGSVKVTVTPVYSFISCPPNLRTKYVEITSDAINIDIHNDIEIKTETPKTTDKGPAKLENDSTTNKGVNNKISSDTNKVPSKTPPIVVKAQSNVSPIKPQAKETTPQNQTTAAAKVTTPKTDTQVNTVKTEPKVTPTNTTQVKVTTAKTTEAKLTPAKPTLTKVTPIKATEAKVTPAKTNEAKVTPAKTNEVKVTPAKTNEAKVTPAKPTEVKVTPTKPIAKVTPKTDAKVTPTKPIAKVTPKTDSKVTKPISTKVTPTKVAQKKSMNKKSFAVQDEYDELDDHDILALMSEGIVLDEYTGSDEE